MRGQTVTATIIDEAGHISGHSYIDLASMLPTFSVSGNFFTYGTERNTNSFWTNHTYGKMGMKKEVKEIDWEKELR